MDSSTIRLTQADMPSGTAEDFEWRGPPLPPHPLLPFGQVVLDALRKHAATATKPAQVEAATGSCKTYADLLRDWVQAAAGWRALGVGAGDTVVMFSMNCHLSYAAIMGAVMEGATVAAMRLLTATEGEARLLLSRVKNIRGMVCNPDNAQVALRLLPRGAVLVVAAERTDVDGALTVAELARRGAVDVDAYRAADVGDIREHVAFVCASSGSTGLPKGVMVSNYAVTAHTIAEPPLDSYGRRGVLPSDVVLVTLDAPPIPKLIPTLRGATRIVVANTDASHCLDAILKYKVSRMYLTPGRHYQLADHIRRLRDQGVGVDLPHLRVAVSGGAPMSAGLQRACSAALGVPVAQAFGCTEQLLVSIDVCAEPRHGSVGRLAAGVRAKLVDTKSGEVIRTANTEGELRLKTECSMKGYMGDEAATAQALDEHGWYRTGDLAKFDEEGRLFVTDRIKELLKFMGKEVTPSEIEDVILSHPGVREACVLGRRHDVAGDVPTAFVVARPGQEVSAEDIQELVQGTLSEWKRLRGGVFFLDEIPALSNGKYDRRALRVRLSQLPPVSDHVLGLGA